MIFEAPDPYDPILEDVDFWRSLDSVLPSVLTGRGDVSVSAIYANATLYVVDAEFGELRVLMYHGSSRDHMGRRFRYWIWDEASSLISHYVGDYGDPDMDILLSEDVY